MTRRLVLIAACALLTVAWESPAAQITAERNKDGVAVKIDGQPFVQYWIKAGSKPVVWPIIGPTGQPMTRAYPMGQGENEREDHVHQRSLWFTHGDVGGVDFWAERASSGKNAPRHPLGEIRHREFVEVTSGPQAVIATRNDWLGPDGKMLEEASRLTFSVDGSTRRIDFDTRLTADPGPVTFGDTKEGSFGVRVACTMKVDANLGGKIVNSDGLCDKEAWGKRASWVDYHGPVAGETVGIAILNHPASFRYPTYWHVRTYGLFAANVFGVGDFTGVKEPVGQYVLPKGKSIDLHYRVLFHKGDEKSAGVAGAFAAYAKEKK